MLIRFSVENWMSFQVKATFSLMASCEGRYRERIPRIGKVRVLPVAAVYGGNASGKTNLFKALHFAKGLIVKGTQPDSLIAVDNFRLGNEHKVDRPSQFEFELLIDETVYVFSFSVNREVVVEERLTHVSGVKKKILYHRILREIKFNSCLIENQSLQFVFKGTRDNQLFLTNSIDQKIDLFEPVYRWFKDILDVGGYLGVDSDFETVVQSRKVYAIDGIDVNVHPVLMRHCLERYLERCSRSSRSQVLFTTHNVMLMDSDLLRRDEIWVTERVGGVSSLRSFSEHKDVRKDLRKSYLQGRLGGIPAISM